MKIKSLAPIFGLSLLVATVPSQAGDAAVSDVQSFLITKGQHYEQASAGAPVIVTASNSPYNFFSTVELSHAGAVTSAQFKTPGGKTNVLNNLGNLFEFQKSFTNKTLLDREFAKGKYAFNFVTESQGVRNPLLTLTPDAYPPIPRIENWSDLQEVDSGLPLTVEWNRFVTGTTNDFVMLEIEDSGGNPVFSTPELLDAGVLCGTNLSATIPENTLTVDQAYEGRLLFVKQTGQNTTNYPGAVGISGFYRETTFPVQTLVVPPAAGRIQLSSASYKVNEGDGVATITVLRSGSSGTVSVNIATSSGTAAEGIDYTANSATLTFEDGVTATNFTFPILNDFLLEGNETVNVSLSSVTGGAILGRSNAVVSIVDDELPAAGVLQFKPANISIKESSPVAKFVVVRTGGKLGPVSVNYTVSNGSAEGGADYVSTNGTLTLANGKVSNIIPISILNDAFDEANETFQVTLTSTTGGAALGTNLVATGTITDDDVAGAISFSAASYSVNENSASATITVNRSGGKAGNASVDFTTVNGVAIAGTDFGATSGTLIFASNEVSKVFSVAITNDLSAEGNESLALQLRNPTGGLVLGKITNATLSIIDDESSVSFTNATYVVNEAGPSIALNVVRSGALTTSVTVDYATVDGSATSPADYRGTNGTITLAANVSSKSISIPIVNDTIVEGSENFSVRLTNPTGGTQLGSVTNATVTIADNDQPGVISFSVNSFSGSEGGNASITINRTGGMASGISVQFTMSGGTATVGTDYTGVSGTLTFAAGETSKKIDVPLITDSASESTETVGLTLSSPSGGATLGAITSAVLSINNVTGGGTSTGSFTLTGPSLKANVNVGGAFQVTPGSGGVEQLFASYVGNILSISAIKGVASLSGTTRTITMVVSLPAGTTGTFPLSTGGTFAGFTTSTFQLSGLCSTTKTYNSTSSNGGGGTLNILEWDSANRRVKATFNFTAKGVESGTVCQNPPSNTTNPTPTDTPTATAGQFWITY